MQPEASRFDAPCASYPAVWKTKQYEPSVAVTTERGTRRRHGCRTYGLDEGRHGNQSDDRENSNQLLHDASPRWVREQRQRKLDAHFHKFCALSIGTTTPRQGAVDGARQPAAALRYFDPAYVR